jgi:hypothetical protein
VTIGHAIVSIKDAVGEPWSAVLVALNRSWLAYFGSLKLKLIVRKTFRWNCGVFIHTWCFQLLLDDDSLERARSLSRDYDSRTLTAHDLDPSDCSDPPLRLDRRDGVPLVDITDRSLTRDCLARACGSKDFGSVTARLRYSFDEGEQVPGQLAGSLGGSTCQTRS